MGTQLIGESFDAVVFPQGEVQLHNQVSSLRELPSSRVVLFDLAPEGVERIAADALPISYRRRLAPHRDGPDLACGVKAAGLQLRTSVLS
jgi:hypothetical protein